MSNRKDLSGGMKMGSPQMPMGEKPKKVSSTLKRLWSYFSEQKILAILIVVFIILSSVSSLYGTRLIGVAIDDYILPRDLDGLVKICFLLGAVYLFGVVTNWIQMLLALNIAQKIVVRIRKDLFDKLQILPLKVFDGKTHGELMSRVTNDVDNIGNALNTAVSQILSSIVSVVVTLAFMIMISPILTIVSLIIIPSILISTKLIMERSKKYFKEQQVILGDLNGLAEEVISGQKVVKVFVNEKEEIKKFNEINDKYKDIAVKAQTFSGMIPPITMAFNNFSYALVSAIGGLLVIYRSLKIGDITSFMIYSRQLSRPLGEMANQYGMVLSAIAGAERVFEIMDEISEPADIANAVELKDVHGNVEFKNVDFSYVEGTPTLKNVSLKAESGQTIALVGPTGAGKTTIINLLTRFYDIQAGTISIDGHNIREVKQDSLRKSLGIVLQDTYLFSGTIKENIRYGRLDATDEEIIEAAKLSNAHSFIRRLLNGYDTEISGDSDSLSQGQKQMIAIARVILADPAILILDEATSSIDTRTEMKIQEAMTNLMKGRTSFVIAHRLSTIRNADMIAVINGGEIIERGNHDELMKQKGFYYNLCSN